MVQVFGTLLWRAAGYLGSGRDYKPSMDHHPSHGNQGRSPSSCPSRNGISRGFLGGRILERFIVGFCGSCWLLSAFAAPI